MILDKQYLTVEKIGSESVFYKYDYPSKDKKIQITLVVVSAVKYPIAYVVAKQVKDAEGNLTVEVKDTIFETSDLKAAWEKFEDYFEETQKEENPQQGGEEPEVQILCMSVNKNGHSYVFLQKEDGTQELLFELDIDNYDIINTKPKFASLDFTGNSYVQEPFNTQWALGLVDNITFADAQIDSTTYVVALKSVDQPGQGPEGPEGPQPPEGPGPEGPPQGPGPEGPPQGPGPEGPPQGPGPEGPPQGPGPEGPPQGPGPEGPPQGPGPEGPPQGPTDGPTHGDDEDKKPHENQKAIVMPLEFSAAVKEISEKTGISPDNIEGALRTERTFDTFLTLQKVDVNELKDKLNASTLTRNQFIKQVVNDFKKI